MQLDMEVGLRLGRIVLDGDPAPPPQKGKAPNFLLWKTAGWIKTPLGTEVGLGPGDIVLDGTPPPQKGAGTAPPQSWPMSTVAQRLDGSR